MGFRSTLTTQCYSGIVVPEWFADKHDYLSFNERDGRKWFSFAVVQERKFYNKFADTELFLDVQKVLTENKVAKMDLILLHECGGITLVIITQDGVKGREPLSWKEVDHVEHDYCYGCSEG